MHSNTSATRPDTCSSSPMLDTSANYSEVCKNVRQKQPRSLARESFQHSLSLVEPKIRSCGSGALSSVAVMQSKTKHDHVFYRGQILTCSQHRLCPHCSSVKAKERRETIEGLFESSSFQQLHSYFVTLTSQRSFKSYKELRSSTSKSFNLLHQSLRKRYSSLVGYIRVVEVTLSRSNGSVNMHLHCIFSFRSPPQDLDSYVRRRWVETCRAAGLVAASAGQDVRAVTQKRGLKRYLSKSLAVEMTSKEKVGRGHTFTIQALINEWHWLRKEHHRRWLTLYSRGMKGARMFSISSNLRDLIERKEEEEQAEEAIELVHLPSWAYNSLASCRAQHRFLALYEPSDVSIQEMIGLDDNVIMRTFELLIDDCRISDFQALSSLFGRKRLNLQSPSSIGAFKEEFLEFFEGL